MKRILTALTLTAALASLGLGCRKPKAMDKGVSASELMATADTQMKQGKFTEARVTLRLSCRLHTSCQQKIQLQYQEFQP